MDNSLFSKNRARLEALLTKATSIGIVVGPEHQDIDKMAASLSLYLSLAASFPKTQVQVISKKDPIVELSNLVGIDRVRKNFEGAAKTLTISIPYKEGEIEKVSYNIEGTKLNINLFAMQDKGITFKEEDIEYIRKGAVPDLLIAVGIESEEELAQSVGEVNIPVVTINKRKVNANYAEVAYVDSAFSSNSEIVSEIIKDMKFSVNEDIAQNILDGVVFATRNFSSPSTGGYSFSAAAFALENNAKRREVRRESTEQPRIKTGNEQSFPVPQDEKKEEVKQESFEQVQQKEQETQEQKDEVPEERNSKKVPRDWFVPKVYKGSKDLEE